jgi:IPT/TIG domain/Fibronectin type III domain
MRLRTNRPLSTRTPHRRMRALLGVLALAAGTLAATGFTPAQAAGNARAAIPEGQSPRAVRTSALPAPGRTLASPNRAAGSASAVTASGLSSCQGTLTTVAGSNTASQDQEMDAVAAIGANDIWTVGFSAPAGGAASTLAEHWNGSAWTKVTTPNGPGVSGDNVLDSVAATATNDAWAVGITRPSNPGAFSPLTEHWDGTSWTIVANANPPSGSNSLYSVKGDSSSDYWAVGRTWQSSTSATPLVEHWNGTAWTIVATPTLTPSFGQLIAVAVLSPTNVWAVGDTSTNGIDYKTLIEHYDGTSWTVSPGTQSAYGNGFLLGISGTASDLYAVGAGMSTGFDQTLIEHWDGTTWTTVANVPTGSDTDLNSVISVSASNVWAVGTTYGGTQQSPADRTYVAHWNGTAWSTVSSPSPGSSSALIDVAALSASDVWPVGTYIDSTGYEQTLAENYCQPPTVTSVSPTSGPAAGGTPVTITGTGFVWATGVMFGSSNAPSFQPGSDTQVTAVSPAGRGGTVDVRVVYFAGLSAVTTADHFTYIATIPTAPLNVQAVAENASGIVYWQAPASDGGATITTYTVTPYIGAVAQPATTLNGSPPPTSTNVMGLTNGTTYTFKVSATNSAGQGPDSAPSNAVTPSTTAIAAGPEASSWGKGRLDVFIKGADGALWHKYYASSVGWQGWSSLGAPTGVTLASDPVAISWGYARIDIFVRGSDNALWHKYYDVNLGGWSSWYSHGGTLTSGPTATSWGVGRLDVFYRGSDNTLRHIFYASSIGSWSAEYSHGGSLASDPSAVSWGVGRIDVVARGMDGSLQHDDYDSAHGGWLLNWESLPGDTIQAGPTITTWGPGRLDVFTRGLDNALHHTYFYNGAWFGWSEHANPADNVLISDPGAVAWSAGRLDIFARGDHNQLLHKYYDSTVGWSDWDEETLSPTPG